MKFILLIIIKVARINGIFMLNLIEHKIYSLMNVKMSSMVVGILTFMSRIDFMLS